MIPKLCGGDIEFGNFILGLDRSQGSGWEASRALLREVRGHPRTSGYGWSRNTSYAGGRGSGYDPQDHGRKFLATNGGCFYIDLDHLEGCLPEVLSSHDHLACWHMLEAERLNIRLLLDDPLDALRRWSHDLALRARVRMADGRKLTAVEVQRFFWDGMHRFVETGGCDGVVPGARDILSLAHDTLRKLQARAFDALADRLDWVLKRMILERALQQHAGLTWEAPALKHLDHLYSSLDDAEELYWLYEKNGLVERHATEERITHFENEPPEDTRAWTRAMLWRQTGLRVTVEAVDWDRVELKERRPGSWPAYHRFELADPLAHTRAQNAALFETNGDAGASGADRNGVAASPWTRAACWPTAWRGWTASTRRRPSRRP